MRLWHEALLPLLPGPQLGGQHRECCALRGLGWGRRHSTVDYVWQYGRGRLVLYHLLVISERDRRKLNTAPEWRQADYRGRRLSPEKPARIPLPTRPIYPEHDDVYLAECLDNLAAKGVII